MRYIILMGLIFTSTCCFAIDQKMIDGAREYDIAVNNLRKIENNLKEQGYFELWSSDNMRRFNPEHIDDTDKRWGVLGTQYNEAKKIVKRYEPIKDKYDRQVAREEEVKDTIQNVAVILAILGVFVSFFWFVNYQQKKCKRLLKEGEITQDEYDQMTQSSHTFSSGGINPATGLPMTGIGISDVGGNVRGSSSSSSMFGSSQNYTSSHRWDKI